MLWKGLVCLPGQQLYIQMTHGGPITGANWMPANMPRLEANQKTHPTFSLRRRQTVSLLSVSECVIGIAPFLDPFPNYIFDALSAGLKV
jgi:hypothetical protein